MIHTAAIMGLVIGLFRKGSLLNLAGHRLRLIYVLVISFLCEALVMTGLLRSAVASDDLYIVMRMLAAAVQYAAVLLFLLGNILKTEARYAKAGLALLAFGSAANAAVIIANYGQMPVSTWLTAGIPGLSDVPLDRIEKAYHYMMATDQTALTWLSDWIPFWSFGWYLVSPGDFLLAAGLILFCFWLTQPELPQLAKTVEHQEDIVYTNGR